MKLLDPTYCSVGDNKTTVVTVERAGEHALNVLAEDLGSAPAPTLGSHL